MTTGPAARVIIADTIKRIAEIWFPGAPFNAEVFRKFDERLALDIESGSIARVKSTCAKYEGWASRKIAGARLERNATDDRTARRSR